MSALLAPSSAAVFDSIRPKEVIVNSTLFIDIGNAVITSDGLTRGQWSNYIQRSLHRERLTEVEELMCVRRLLEHAPWYEWHNGGPISGGEDLPDPYGADRYESVVLLDIDGMLKDEDPRRDKGAYIDPAMMDRLAKIVQATGAKIVLTSPWRHSHLKFSCNGFVSDHAHIRHLQAELDRCGLEMAGMTPDTQLSGARARPLEIMEWLRRFWKTSHYVILEDDTFWEWGWLRDHVVTAGTPSGKDRYGHPRTQKGSHRRARTACHSHPAGQRRR